MTCPMKDSAIRLYNTETNMEFRDVLHKKAVTPIGCNHSQCLGSVVGAQTNTRPNDGHRHPTEILEHARDFLQEYYESSDIGASERPNMETRLNQIEIEVEKIGTYELTLEEVTFGARLAWRNSSRCIARMFWPKLEIFDCRHVKTTDEMAECLLRHIEYGINGGNIRVAITLFPQRIPGREDFRMWNPQFYNFAGYKMPDGTIIGDPQNVPLTNVCESLGWKGPGGRFDILPLIVSAPGQPPKLFEIPKHLQHNVVLEHPKYEWFKEMGLQWFAMPAVADMRFDVGGIEFTAAPFNGWYTSPEIGTRNLCDINRYNISEEVALKMGLDVSSQSTLWKDSAMVQINIAVLHSYQKAGVSLVDQHTAANAYMKFMASEHRERGGCPSDWVWLVPPIGGSLTPLYTQDMINYKLRPSYEYQDKAWQKLIEEINGTEGNSKN